MESTPSVFIKGYPYFLDKFRKKKTDVLSTRILLKRTLVLRGEEAARVFYDQEKFIRKGATPKRFQKTLFGQGGVQGMDAEAHKHRKELFMQAMDKKSLTRLYNHFETYLDQASRQ